MPNATMSIKKIKQIAIPMFCFVSGFLIMLLAKSEFLRHCGGMMIAVSVYVIMSCGKKNKV
jgi:hypothetical protein